MVDVRFVNDTTPIRVTSETQVKSIAVKSSMGTDNHDELSNRDLPDQHPISAITGLQEALDTIPYDYVSEAELEAALLEKQDVIRDLSEIRQGATLGATAVQPSELESYATKDYVGDAVLTIQRNNTNIDTFTANAKVNKTINIAVPTTAAEVNALPDSTKYGYSIDLSLNTTDYKLILTLKDQDGTILNSKTVDFPIESVVVNGTYDSINKKIVLTLQNGNTIDIPVGDLIAGLQTEITSENKLDADLVDDSTSTSKFVTSNEKNTWNSKQDTISDLATIRSGAALGATAVQPSDLATVATSGSYNDLSNKPTIPAAQVNADWNATSGVARILNKPTIPTVPTNVSAFTNDAGYITSAALIGYATESYVTTATANMQTTGNLVTSISSSSTDAQYPSAKCMYDLIGDVETLINAL